MDRRAVLDSISQESRGSKNSGSTISPWWCDMESVLYGIRISHEWQNGCIPTRSIDGQENIIRNKKNNPRAKVSQIIFAIGCHWIISRPVPLDGRPSISRKYLLLTPFFPFSLSFPYVGKRRRPLEELTSWKERKRGAIEQRQNQHLVAIFIKILAFPLNFDNTFLREIPLRCPFVILLCIRTFFGRWQNSQLRWKRIWTQGSFFSSFPLSFSPSSSPALPLFPKAERDFYYWAPGRGKPG